MELSNQGLSSLRVKNALYSITIQLVYHAITDIHKGPKLLAKSRIQLDLNFLFKKQKQNCYS